MIVAAALLAIASTSPNVKESVALLYKQSDNGGMEFNCTATAFKRDGKDTLFLSAGHCVSKVGDEGKDEVITTPVFLSMDDPNNKQFIRAEIREVGKREKAYDYAILAAPIDVPVIPLGDERKESPSAAVINVAAPMGIGRVAFFGNVALTVIDRPIEDETQKLNWMGGMLIQVPVEGGSSGSAVVSLDTGTIIGVMVGKYRSLSIAVPVSRAVNPPADMVLFTKEGK